MQKAGNGVVDHTRLWDRPDIRDALRARDVGRIFRYYRQHTGASQTQVASRTGLSQPDVSDIERGRRLVQSLDVLHRCAAGLHIPPGLLGLAEPPQPDHTAAADPDPVVTMPWTDLGAVQALQALTMEGGPPVPSNRREFLAQVTAPALAAAAAKWLHTDVRLPDSAAGRRITAPVAAAFHTRLDALRHLDDQLGSGQLQPIAHEELRLTTTCLTTGTYDQTTMRGLYSAASEASRICGWLAYDTGHHTTARRHYLSSLRAAASAGDDLAGAHTLSYAAIQAYSTGRPRDAVKMLDAAHTRTRTVATPRVKAMLHARQARAYSKTGEDRTGCIRSINAAFDAYAQGTRDDDPAFTYWVSEAELLSIAGSSALSQGDHRQAIGYFQRATDAAAYDDAGYPRAAAIYYARAAEAHLGLGEIEDACAAASSAVRCLDRVDSSRGTSTLADLQTHLGRHSSIPIVRDLLDQIA